MMKLSNLSGGIPSIHKLKGSISSPKTLQGRVGVGDVYTAAIDPSVIKQLVEAYLEENLNPAGPTASIGTVNLLADKWLGDTNLYYQIVSIDGVTENSQVDLTPDVEQLLVFYEKDLTFVTENDGGVVTVYAIGQKPANDYTIQVTITEVSV